jgi:hypothetical protein
MNANDTQVAGDHYKRQTIQPWDYIAANGLGFFEGNVVKYVSRWRDKAGVEDLRKARHYLDKLIELETKDAHHPAGIINAGHNPRKDFLEKT